MRRLRAAIPWVGAAVIVAVCVAGPRIRASGTVLGTPMPPFLGPWNPAIDWLWAVIAAVSLVLAVVGLPRLLGSPAALFMAGTFVATLVVRLTVNAARIGPGGWDLPFDPSRGFEGKNEYLPALGALEYGERFLLDRWHEILATLPPHAAAHPPGTLLTLDWFGITTPAGMAALCIGLGSAATPLAYLAFRRLVDEPVARAAALLLVLSPDAILFTATSADALFLFVAVLGLWPMAIWVATGNRWALAIGAALAAVGTFFAWSLPAVAAWAAVLAWRRGGVRRFVTLAAACGVACVVLYGGLYLAAGYDVLHSFLATEDVYRFSVASVRPYWFWVVGSPVAFLVVAGIPVTWLALRALARGSEIAVATAIVLAIAALLGFTKAETERIWLYLVPLLVLAAAEALPRSRVRLVLALLAAQALLIQVLFDTVW